MNVARPVEPARACARRRAIGAAFAAMLGSAACGGHGAGPTKAPSDGRGAGTAAGRDYPGILHPPSELTPNFAVEQHVEAAKDGRTGGFDAVVQKNGDELVVVGLGPMGVRAFVLRQAGDAVHFEQRMGPELPFPPRNVLVDVHRVFFKRLPTDASRAPERHGTIDDEDVTEVWNGDMLVERRYARAGQKGFVRVLYGPGCTAARCEPADVRVVNEWFGYELRIKNERYHAL